MKNRKFFIYLVLKCLYEKAALSSRAVLLGRNCENAAKKALWLCPVILYGYGIAAKSKPAEIA